MSVSKRRGQFLLITTILLSVLMVCAFALAAWSFSTGHKNACSARDASLDVLRDILIKTEPSRLQLRPLPTDLTTQERAAVAFYAYSFGRINKARC